MFYAYNVLSILVDLGVVVDTYIDSYNSGSHTGASLE